VADSPESLRLQVATPTGRALDIEVEWVQVPGAEGEFGILPGHLPLLASLKPGVLRYCQRGTERVAAVDVGFAEAGPARVSLLTETYAPPERVEMAAAKSELDEAEKRLAEYAEICEGPEYEEIQREVAWARARIEAAEQG
jgi:F-type H+-transporting ATPase subunit epsilon